MHLIPRCKDTHELVETGETLSINALGFSGMLLVKSDKELEAVKSEGIGKILKSVALESVHDLQVAGTSAD
jgi:ATP adenylyltransferase